MADVQPLRGIRYAADKVGDIAQVVTPPYDIISPEAQERYYARNPYNVIRLEFGKTLPDDTTLNNVYTRAAATFAEWRFQDILQQERSPAYYLYQQTFSHAGQSHTRTSLLGRVRLEPWSERIVLRHEHTLAKAKNDRLQLLRACAANFSPIMSLYNDPQGRIRHLLSTYAANAEVHFVDEAGEEHRLHAITDVQEIALIQDFFSQRQLYIADGHHRYETALAYRQEILEQRKELHPEDAANFVMMALIDMDDPGMLVLPTHRLLFDMSEYALSQLSREHLEQFFAVQELPMTTSDEEVQRQLQDAGQQGQSAFVLYRPQQTLLLTLNEQGRAQMNDQSHSKAWNELDVAMAHRLILERLLGLNAQDMTAGTHVRYTHDTNAAFQAVQRGEAQVALLLNATRVRQICDVALADDQMPQKSTYFYPKLITGLVINPLW